MFDPELDDFKRRIDLCQYMASQGYSLDRKLSSRRCSMMRGPGDDKLIVIIGPKAPHYWIYCSIRDDQDNGTIMDFVGRRKHLNTGQVRKELRPWVGRHSPALPNYTPLLPALNDIGSVDLVYNRMQVPDRHVYLEQERRIPRELLQSERFAGRIRVNAHGNAIFPHFEAGGLTGFEIKGQDFTGFSPGGFKALFESHDLPDDDALVITESAIDALSHAALFPHARARYRSIGGQLNHHQPDLICAAVMNLPDGSKVIAAMDNDDPGHKLASMIEQAVLNADRPSITFKAHFPKILGRDWNDILRERSQPRPSSIVRPFNFSTFLL